MQYSRDLVTNVRRVTFSRPLAGEVPAQGIFRLVERGETSFSVSTVRYGLGLKFENGRLETEQGRNDFAMGLIQLTVIFVQNAGHDAFCALWNPDPEEKAYRAAFNVVNYDNFMEAMKRERNEFNIVLKDPVGLIKIHSKTAKLIQQKSGVWPDSMTCGRELLDAFTLDNPQVTEFPFGR